MRNNDAIMKELAYEPFFRNTARRTRNHSHFSDACQMKRNCRSTAITKLHLYWISVQIVVISRTVSEVYPRLTLSKVLHLCQLANAQWLGSIHAYRSGVVEVCPCQAFHMSTGELNLGPQTWAATTLSTESFLQHLLNDL